MNTEKYKNVSQNFTQCLAQNSVSSSSLPYIRHTLSSQPFVQNGQVFQVLVIGGTIYQKALMRKQNDNFHLMSQEQGNQPPFTSKEALLSFLDQHLETDIEVLAINFAYPLTPVFREGRVDGTLVSGSKENTFTGLAGQTVGEEIEKHFWQTSERKLKVAVANDTICLLLSGLMQYQWDEIAAGIVGTGLNFAIFESANTCVNLESANFNEFPSTHAGEKIDAESAAPGKGLFEKYVSGAYLYKHFNILAMERGLNVQISSTQKLDELSQNRNTEEGKLAKKVLTQSYSLVAAQIAGILEFQKRDLIFIMQGSLFWRGYQYKENVEKLVEKLSPQYKATYVNIFHSDLYGAAKLVA